MLYLLYISKKWKKPCICPYGFFLCLLYHIFRIFSSSVSLHLLRGLRPPHAVACSPLNQKRGLRPRNIYYICKSSLCVNSVSDAIKSSTSLSCSSNCLLSSFSLSISNSLTYVLALTFDTLVESFNSSIS